MNPRWSGGTLLKHAVRRARACRTMVQIYGQPCYISALCLNLLAIKYLRNILWLSGEEALPLSKHHEGLLRALSKPLPSISLILASYALRRFWPSILQSFSTALNEGFSTFVIFIRHFRTRITICIINLASNSGNHIVAVRTNSRSALTAHVRRWRNQNLAAVQAVV